MGSLAGMPLGFAMAGVCVEAFGRSATLGGMAAATFVVSAALLADRTVRRIDAHHQLAKLQEYSDVDYS